MILHYKYWWHYLYNLKGKRFFGTYTSIIAVLREKEFCFNLCNLFMKKVFPKNCINSLVSIKTSTYVMYQTRHNDEVYKSGLHFIVDHISCYAVWPWACIQSSWYMSALVTTVNSRKCTALCVLPCIPATWEVETPLDILHWQPTTFITHIDD